MSIYFKGNKVSKHFTAAEYNHDNSKDVFMTADTLIFISCIEEFREWTGRSMYVTSWFRDPAVNKACGGISTSNHLTGTAMDFYYKDQKMNDETRFIRRAIKWGEICKAHGVIGEAGLYSGFYHFGIQNAAQAAANNYKFMHWDSRSGNQINRPFAVLNVF